MMKHTRGTSPEELWKTYAHILDDLVEREIERSIQKREKNLPYEK